MTLRACARFGFLLLLLCGIGSAQQPAPVSGTAQTPSQTPDQPPVQTPDQPPTNDPNAERRDDRQRPLTPEEQRELDIRQFDPLYRDPNASPGSTPNTNVPAQNNDNTPNPQPKSNSLDAPIPGSIASGNLLNNGSQSLGPRVVGDDDQGDAQAYTGPAVLSRAYTINRPMIAQDVKWSENFGLGFTFSTGATSAALTPTGSLVGSGNLYGLSLTAGFGGRKVFHKDQFGIRAATQYQEYFPTTQSYNGPNINVSADYSHVISRHLTVNIAGTSLITSQNYTLQNPVIEPDISVANINLASSPNIQIFDTTTKQFSLQASVTYQLNARLSFNFGGGYFAVIRGNTALLGTDGEQAQGDVNYRWSKKTTVGVYYSHSHYQYQHGFGVSDSNSIGLIYSYAFSRTLQFRLRGGVSQNESLALTQVPLNPVIAALLGESGVVLDLYQKAATSDISAQIVKDFNAGRTASISFVNGISPGNGVFQASKQQSLAFNYAFKVKRVYQVRAGASHDTLTSISQTIGGYTGETVQVSISRAFRKGFSSSLMAAYRRQSISGAPSVTPQYLMTAGISWSPPNGKLWPF